MCTNPITIKRNYPLIGERKYVVPCGKCDECARKKQMEFSALALHQALKSDSLHFITFTYKDSALPLAISEDTLDGPRLVGFQRGIDQPPLKDAFYHKVFGSLVFENRVVDVADDLYLCASPCREDIKLTLKRFRNEFKRITGEKPDFKYAVFFELGEERGRPHAHGIFFGLTTFGVKLLTDLWNEYFGFTYIVPQDYNRKLSLEEVKKVTTYTSKYISKGVHSRWTHLLPYVEKPRRQSSVNFGGFSDAELSQLCDFTCAAIFSSQPIIDFRTLTFWVVSYLDGKVCL